MKKIDNITFNPRMRLIHRTTEYPNGDKVETIRTKDLGPYVKVLFKLSVGLTTYLIGIWRS